MAEKEPLQKMKGHNKRPQKEVLQFLRDQILPKPESKDSDRKGSGKGSGQPKGKRIRIDEVMASDPGESLADKFSRVIAA